MFKFFIFALIGPLLVCVGAFFAGFNFDHRGPEAILTFGVSTLAYLMALAAILEAQS